MESALLLLSPFVVSLLTQLVKNIRPFSDTKGYRAGAIRFVAVSLSFGAALLTQLAGSGEVTIFSIETFAETFVLFLSATGTYFFAKRATE